MTKLVSLRVIVPADDGAAIGDVQKRLRERLDDLGTEALSNGSEGEPGSRVRVHWQAADVLQGSGERAPSPARRGRKPRVAPDQGSLPT